MSIYNFFKDIVIRDKDTKAWRDFTASVLDPRADGDAREQILDAANAVSNILEQTRCTFQAEAAARVIREIADITFSNGFDKAILNIKLISAVMRADIRELNLNESDRSGIYIENAHKYVDSPEVVALLAEKGVLQNNPHPYAYPTFSLS